MDVMKVRMQTDAGRPRLGGTGGRLSLVQTVRLLAGGAHGARWYLRGLAPCMQRAAAVNGASMACYDVTKQAANRILGGGSVGGEGARGAGDAEEEVADTVAARVVAALLGGVAASVAGNPFDVVKTRLMAQSHEPALRRYSGALDCLQKVVRTEG